MAPPDDDVRAGCRAVLEASWRPADGFCPPNPTVYPHQWLWDSCFHAVAWAALDDDRAAVELASCLRGQLPTGFVPHMRYLGPSVHRGPLSDRSSFTQPPIYAHAARFARDRGIDVPAQTVDAIGRGLDWLWNARRTDDGLVFIVHPWESGADDSPRWDSWVGLPAYDKPQYRDYDRRTVDDAEFDDVGAAVWSRSFVAAPAAFTALVAHAFAEYAALTGRQEWADRAAAVAAAMDEQLWDEPSRLWVDRAVVGGGASCTWPTLDGTIGALVTADERRAHTVLDQLLDDRRFGAPFGLRYVPPGHPAYEADRYWRGPAWPQLNYLLWLAARRWGRDDVAGRIAEMTRDGVLRSGFAEYWNPETGDGLGAVPQGWAALAAAMT